MIEILNISELDFIARSGLPESIKKTEGDWFVFLNNEAYGRFLTYESALDYVRDLQGWFS